MQGRWTIHMRDWGHLVAPTDPKDVVAGSWPVVPCDDAAIERGQAYLSPIIEALVARERGSRGAWNQPNVREWVAGVLRAAGETP